MLKSTKASFTPGLNILLQKARCLLIGCLISVTPAQTPKFRQDILAQHPNECITKGSSDNHLMWRDEMECAIKVHDCCNSVGGSGLEEDSRELKGRARENKHTTNK